MEYFGLTDKGRVRPTNQDIYQIEAREDNQTVLLVVCDGMGGANAGNVASRFAARWMRRTRPCSVWPGGSQSSAAWAQRSSRRSCRAARRP